MFDGDAPLLPVPAVSAEVGGILQRFVHEWRDHGCSPWVLEVLSQGYKIRFLEPPPLRHTPIYFGTLSPDKRKVCSQLVQGPPGESSNRSGTVDFISGILQPAVRGPEGIGPMETGYRSIDAEHVCGHSNLPDGHSGPHQTVPNVRKLGSVPGSTGCLSSDPDSYISPQVSTVPVRQVYLPVSSTSYRLDNRPMAIYQHNGRGKEDATQTRHPSLHVSRRLVSGSRFRNDSVRPT